MAAITLFDASDDIVEIIAHSGQGQTFSVHRRLLIESSDYFRRAANLFINDDTSACFKTYGPVFITTEVPSEAVRCFVQWLYTGHLTPTTSYGESLGVAGILSLFGWTSHQLNNTGFRDLLVDKIIDIVSAQPNADNIYEILNNLDDTNGGMLMFLTDFIVHTKLHDRTLNAEIAERLTMCKNKDIILQGLAHSFLEMKIDSNEPGKLPPWLENRCQYHEHPALTCCSKSPGVTMAEEALLELRTPPPAPKKQKRKALNTYKFEDEVADEIIVLDKRSRIETPTRFTRSSLRTPTAPVKPEVRRGRNVPKWTNEERIEVLRLYWLNPDFGHAQAVARHNEGYCAAHGFERAAQGLGGQYREIMGGSLEETRHLIPEKIAELESEMEIEEGEVGVAA